MPAVFGRGGEFVVLNPGQHLGGAALPPPRGGAEERGDKENPRHPGPQSPGQNGKTPAARAAGQGKEGFIAAGPGFSPRPQGGAAKSKFTYSSILITGICL